MTHKLVFDANLAAHLCLVAADGKDLIHYPGKICHFAIREPTAKGRVIIYDRNIFGPGYLK